MVQQALNNLGDKMKKKTKITIGALAVVGGIAAGFAIKQKIEKIVDEHLHRDGIAVIKRNLMSKKNREDFANNPEVILGRLFHENAPQINVSVKNSEGRNINALLYKQENEPSKYVILVHGYRASVKSVSYLAKDILKQVIMCLSPIFARISAVITIIAQWVGTKDLTSLIG